MIKYLKDNTLAREELFNHKLFYELKKSAAKRHYHLKIFRPNADFEGFDVFIDDGDKIGKYQLKTKLDSQTNKWKIRNTLLLPKKVNAEKLRWSNPLCPSIDCGVILMDIKSDNLEFKIDYYYTDFYFIKLIALGVIDNKRAKNVKQTATETIEKLLLTKKTKDTIEISNKLFIKLKNPDALLTVTGFDSIEGINFQTFYMQHFNEHNIEKDAGFGNLKNTFLNEFKRLI